MSSEGVAVGDVEIELVMILTFSYGHETLTYCIILCEDDLAPATQDREADS